MSRKPTLKAMRALQSQIELLTKLRRAEAEQRDIGLIALLTNPALSQRARFIARSPLADPALWDDPGNWAEERAHALVEEIIKANAKESS